MKRLERARDPHSAEHDTKEERRQKDRKLDGSFKFHTNKIGATLVELETFSD
jgi:hypothetical protein